jgi:hypothetical protein
VAEGVHQTLWRPNREDGFAYRQTGVVAKAWNGLQVAVKHSKEATIRRAISRNNFGPECRGCICERDGVGARDNVTVGDCFLRRNSNGRSVRRYLLRRLSERRDGIDGRADFFEQLAWRESGPQDS